MLLEEGLCYDQCVLLSKLYEPLSCFILTPRSNLPVTPAVSWLPTFAFQSPIMKRTFFGVLVLKGLVGLHRTVQLQLLQRYWLGHRLGITVILNGLPWKWTETILSFLRLHSSTAFQPLLLTVMATPFLLRDSCKRWVIFNNWKKAPALTWDAWTLWLWPITWATSPLPHRTRRPAAHTVTRRGQAALHTVQWRERGPSTPASSLLTLKTIQCTCKNDSFSLTKTLTAVF